MRTSTPLVFVLLAGGPAVAAEILKPPDPQRVLYVGNRGTPRAGAYARFLAMMLSAGDPLDARRLAAYTLI